MNQSRRRRALRRTGVAGLVTAFLCIGYATAFGHAVVYPRSSTAGGRERYTIRVPNERMVPTTRVEIQFPSAMRVTSFYDTPGWTLEIVRDSAKRIAGAVWTGSLPPEHTVEFSFSGVNPASPTEIQWPVLQRYADGEDANWTGPAGSDRPASVTTIIDTSGSETSPESRSSTAPSPWISYAALAVSLLSLGLVLRSSNRT